MDSGSANTFVVEPKDEEKFYPSKVRKLIQEIMDDKLKNETYDANNTPNLAEELVKRIRSKVRDSIKMPRFKIAVQVIIGEIKGQGCKVTSKNLWDPTWDNYASYAFQNVFNPSHHYTNRKVSMAQQSYLESIMNELILDRNGYHLLQFYQTQLQIYLKNNINKRYNSN